MNFSRTDFAAGDQSQNIVISIADTKSGPPYAQRVTDMLPQELVTASSIDMKRGDNSHNKLCDGKPSEKPRNRTSNDPAISQMMSNGIMSNAHLIGRHSSCTSVDSFLLHEKKMSSLHQQINMLKYNQAKREIEALDYISKISSAQENILGQGYQFMRNTIPVASVESLIRHRASILDPVANMKKDESIEYDALSTNSTCTRLPGADSAINNRLRMPERLSVNHLTQKRAPKDDQSSLAIVATHYKPQTQYTPATKQKGRPSLFPQKLYQLLLDLEHEEGGRDIISFVLDGRAFLIHNPKKFMEQVVSRYFSTRHIASFQRQLNAYSFHQVLTGPYKGAYFHEHFIRGQPELCIRIKRIEQKRQSRKEI